MLSSSRVQAPVRPASPLGAACRSAAFGAAVALGLHASLSLSAAWKPAWALQLMEVLREEPLVQVDAPAEPAREAAGGARAGIRAHSSLAAHTRVVHRAPVHAVTRRDVPAQGAAAAVAYQRHLRVEESGTYRFRLEADDGAQLFLDSRLIVDNDGIHEAISKRGEIDLRSGRHRIRVWYFQGMKYQLALQLFVTPPGASERSFCSNM
jgi:hypothetical protein